MGLFSINIKSFDFKRLEVEAKKAGLPEVEDLAKKLKTALFNWLKVELTEKGGFIGGIVLSILKSFEDEIDEALDKIDGVEG